MQTTAELLAMRGVDWTPFRLDVIFFKKKRPPREGFHVPAAAFVSACAGAKLRHGGRGAANFEIISPTHNRTEGRAPVWGSEFTSKRRRTTGGIQQKPLLG